MESTFPMRTTHPLTKRLLPPDLTRWSKAMIWWGLLLVVAMLSTGCTSYVSLTRKMVLENDFKDDELVRIQYYNSEDIFFERTITGDVKLDEGKVVGRGRVVDEVIVDCRTPGILKRIESDPPRLGNKGLLLWVSFERGTTVPFIGYGDGIFALHAPKGTVKLGKIVYSVKNDLAGETRPHLLIENDALEAIKNRRKMPGRRLGEDQ